MQNQKIRIRLKAFDYRLIFCVLAGARPHWLRAPFPNFRRQLTGLAL